MSESILDLRFSQRLPGPVKKKRILLVDHSDSKRDLRADKDVLAVISNCPQLNNPCNGWNPTPIRIIEWQPAG